jgi:hypothetical protein
MKILLLCGGRVGSYTIAEWLSKELTLTFITEMNDSINYKNMDNIILKRTLDNNNFNFEDIKHFDKIIILYRKNTLEQSESNLFAILKNKWHHSKDTEDGYYEIDEKFLVENHDTIWLSKYHNNHENQRLLDLDFGFKITYEDIFEDLIGQKLIEDYIGFKSKINLNPMLKLRKNKDKTTINSYEREIDILNKKNESLNSIIDNFKKFYKKFYNKLL